MTINSQERFIAALWDWGILDGCFGNTKIALTDIDGLVERKGQFLLIEAKGKGVELKDGQRRLLITLSNLSQFTVFIVWGDKNKPEKLQIFSRGRQYSRKDTNLEHFRQKVSEWYIMADTRQGIVRP